MFVPQSPLHAAPPHGRRYGNQDEPRRVSATSAPVPLVRGYAVVALHRDPVTSRSYFLLRREEAA